MGQRILLALTMVATLLLRPEIVLAQAKHLSLDSVQGLVLNNVTAEPETMQGKKGLKVVVTTPSAQHARIEGLEFSDGIITAEIAGEPAPNAGEGARGFVGIAFRMQQDPGVCDIFYLRPTNGRTDDQERRNHAVQYQSLPDWGWARLRKETPSRYEAYADLVTGAWTKIKIEVQGAKARLYVHDQQQPTLIVNDLKTGATGKGAVALWLEPGTIAHFRDITVTPASASAPAAK